MANKDRLLPGETLMSGEELISENLNYKLRMQRDGNLVLYNGTKAIWSTATNGKDGAVCVMKNRGVLVVHRNGDLWKSDNSGISGSYLIVQNDGNLVIYGPDWSTGTNGK